MVEPKVNKTKTQPKRFYRQVPDFNLVPPEYRKPTMFSPHLLLRLLIIVIIAAELFFTWNLYQEKSRLVTAIDSVRLQIQQTEDKMAIISAEKDLKKEHQALQDDWIALTAKQTDWPRILSAFLESKPQGIKLSALQQAGGLPNANGMASDYASLLQYRSILLDSPAISQIISLNSKESDGPIAFSLSVEIAGER